jgi:enoyl-CoA hydratase/carnithine racemase
MGRVRAPVPGGRLRCARMGDNVLFEKRDGVGVVTLNRPDRMNAWNSSLESDYWDAVDEAMAADDVRVIVFTGAGRGYCVGADFDVLQGIQQTGQEERKERPPLHSTLRLAKPTIAAINGACAGMGLAQAVMCDLRFAATGVKFTTAFSRRGLIAEFGLSWTLPRVVGRSNALDLLMSGRTFTAEEAAEMGLVNKVLPGELLMDHVMDYAIDMATYASPASMAVIKQQVIADESASYAESCERYPALMKASFTRPDFKEGVKSFLEKRKPAFPGVPDDLKG